MAAPPKWAQDLVLRVALDEGREDIPELTWHRRSVRYRPRAPHMREWMTERPDLQARMDRQAARLAEGSSGRAWNDGSRVHVTAGTDRTDQKLVLLHELAHWLTPKEHHSGRFWDTAWRLYRRYGVPIRYAKLREGAYRKGALVAASRRPSL